MCPPRGGHGRIDVGEHAAAPARDVGVAPPRRARRARGRRRHVPGGRVAHRLQRRLGQLADAGDHPIDDFLDARLVHRAVDVNPKLLQGQGVAERSPESPDLAALMAHARALVGVELGELADALGLPVPVGRVRTKGWSGQVLEHELGVAIGGSRGPDFAALGIELKTVPVDDTWRPANRPPSARIDPIAIAGESWETSYVREKLARVLFVALEVGARSVGERRVAAVRLWSPDARRGARAARRLRADRPWLLPAGARRRADRPHRDRPAGPPQGARRRRPTRRPTIPRGAPCASASTASTCAPPSSKRSSVASRDAQPYLSLTNAPRIRPGDGGLPWGFRDQRAWLRR